MLPGTLYRTTRYQLGAIRIAPSSLMMSPLSIGFSIMVGAASRMGLNVPTRLICTAFTKESRECGSLLPTSFSARPMPAQLTRPCSLPKITYSLISVMVYLLS